MRMGKIVKEKYPGASEEDQEAVRQHAIAALNLTQKAKEVACERTMTVGENRGEHGAHRRRAQIAMDVRELDIDLIDRINPFGEAYAILAKIDERGER